ncbi:MAG: ABC transporter ATP-binding protein [Phycisphaerae bacterium]
MSQAIENELPAGEIEALESALAAAEAVLDGPPPADVPIAGADTFRAWIDRAVRGESWPDPAAIIPNHHWKETKQHVSQLTRLWCALRTRDSVCDALAARVRTVLEAYVTFGLVYALNADERVGVDEATGEPRYVRRYDLPRSAHVGVFRALLDGWERPVDRAPIPGLVSLLLEQANPGRAGSSLGFYWSHIDFYLRTVRDGEAAPPPDLLRELVSAPSITAEDVWIRFMIRYHRREATIRDSLLGLIGRGDSGSDGPRRGRAAFWALRGVNLTARPGDVLGIVGRNGSGKTTLLKALAGILGADRGHVEVRGKVGCLLSFGVGFNARLSGRENISLHGSILGLSEQDVDERLDRIVAFSELGEFIHAPVRTYSAGMRGRLGFSIAIHIDPDVLILDEVLTVGDASFREKAGSIVDRFRSENKTVVIASHNMELIRDVCTRALWLDGGRVRLEGTPTEITRAYVAWCREQRSEAVRSDA